MNSDLRKWMFSAGLATALAVGTGATVARGQYSAEPPPGSRADQREDWREAQRLNRQAQRAEQRLRRDSAYFGKHSPEARADRRQLRYDRQQMKQLRRDMRYDRRVRESREDGWR